MCLSDSGNLSFDNNSTTTCAGPQTNITGLTVTNGGGFTAAGTAGFAATGTGGVTTTSGNIATTSGNISTTSGNLNVGGTSNFLGALANSAGNLLLDDNVAVSGTLGVTGATTTNGITNTGNIATTTLTTTGGATVGNGLTVSAGGANISGGINNNGGGITNAGAITGATNVTASGTVTANTVTAATVNSTTINNSGTLTSNAVAVGPGGLSVAPGAPVSMGGNRVQNVAAPVAATDAANKAYVDQALGASSGALDARVDSAFEEIDKNTEGVALAIALGGLALPAGKAFALGANIGFYDDKQALAAQTAIRLNDVVQFNAGVGVGFDHNKVGGRAGISAAW